MSTLGFKKREQYSNFIDYIKKKKNGVSENINCVNLFNTALTKIEASEPNIAITLLKTLLKKDPYDVEAKKLLQSLKNNNNDCS